MNKSRILLVALLLMAFSAPGLAAQPVSVVLEGERLNSDVPPMLEKGRVLVPMRAIFEALGSEVDWDGASRTVIATAGSDPSTGLPRLLKLTVGQKTAYLGGWPVELDVPARIISGRVLVPVRFVAEALGADVTWLPAERTVTISLALPSGSAGLEIQSVATVAFLAPPGWSVNRPLGLPANERQRSLVAALDRLARALGQARIIPSGRSEGESRRVRLQVDGPWQDNEGLNMYGGFLTLEISGCYARLEWPERFPDGLDLWFPTDALRRELDGVTALLPPAFPTKSIRAAEEPAALLSPTGLELEPAETNLPPGQVLSLIADPNRGVYKLLFVPSEATKTGAGAVDAGATLVYVSAEGTDWRPVEEAGVEAIAPTALGILADPGTETWLASGADGGIYLAAQPSTGQRHWERVWGFPEPIYQYAPVAYVADPLDARRVYVQFDHDTVHPTSRGLLLTEDGGRTWLESGVNGDAHLSLFFPGKPWPDPRTPRKVYLEGCVSVVQDGLVNVSVRGVLVSADAGRTWSLLAGVGRIYGLTSGDRGTVLVCGTARSGGVGGTADTTHCLLTSPDGGATWQERALPFEPYRLVLDPAAPTQLVALGVVPGEPFRGLYVFFSTDGGASWRKSGQPLREGTLLVYQAAGGNIFLGTARGLTIIGLK